MVLCVRDVLPGMLLLVDGVRAASWCLAGGRAPGQVAALAPSRVGEWGCWLLGVGALCL